MYVSMYVCMCVFCVCVCMYVCRCIHICIILNITFTLLMAYFYNTTRIDTYYNFVVFSITINIITHVISMQ